MQLSSKTLTEQQIYDYSLNFIRVKLFTIPGLSTPGPFGGKSRQIQVDLDQNLLCFFCFIHQKTARIRAGLRAAAGAHFVPTQQEPPHSNHALLWRVAVKCSERLEWL